MRACVLSTNDVESWSMLTQLAPFYESLIPGTAEALSTVSLAKFAAVVSENGQGAREERSDVLRVASNLLMCLPPYLPPSLSVPLTAAF
jgi:hypothetical protein